MAAMAAGGSIQPSSRTSQHQPHRRADLGSPQPGVQAPRAAIPDGSPIEATRPKLVTTSTRARQRSRHTCGPSRSSISTALALPSGAAGQEADQEPWSHQADRASGRRNGSTHRPLGTSSSAPTQCVTRFVPERSNAARKRHFAIARNHSSLSRWPNCHSASNSRSSMAKSARSSDSQKTGPSASPPFRSQCPQPRRR